MARDVYEEGAVILPCVKVQSDYQDIEDIIRMCQLRIRVPEQVVGRLPGAARRGPRRRARGHGAGRPRSAGTGSTRSSPHGSTTAKGGWPRRSDGCPTGDLTIHTEHDPFERAPDGVPLKVTVEITDDEIEVDLRDNPDCHAVRPEPDARPPPGSAAMLGVMNAINGYAPANAGTFRRLHVQLRENCVVGIPRHPASCSVSTCNLPDRVGNAVQRAIAELADGYGLAEVGLSVPASVGVMSGHDRRHGDEPFIDQMVLAFTCGPGGPVGRRLADAGRDRRRRACCSGTRSRSTSCASRSGSTATGS